jgi:hypothetical protein
MNLRRLTARTAVAGVTTALAAGALVGLGTTAANAATVTNTYTCSIPSLYSGDFALTVSGELPVPQYWAGAAVPAGLLNVTATSTVPATAAPLLAQLGYTGAKSDDFAFTFGDTTVPVPLTGSFAASGGNTTWNATGANLAFETPAPGNTSAILPSAFTLTTSGGSSAPVNLNCALAAGQTAQTLASIDLLQQKSAVTAPKSVKAKAGKPAKIKVSVKSTSLNAAVTEGTVVAKKGKKTVGTAKLTKKGTAVLKVKKLKAGKNKLTISFAGTDSIAASKAKTTVKVAAKK